MPIKKQKVAVIGAGGFIGRAVFEEFKKHYAAIGTAHSSKVDGTQKLDITDARAVKKFVSASNPDAVILMAAAARPEQCERDRAYADSVNVLGTRNVVDACRASSPRFFYFSTDFVFDGGKGNYSEDDKPNPINVYGKTKLEGEIIAKGLSNHLVIRTSTPYDFTRRSERFLNSAYERLSRGKKVTAFSDTVRSPTLPSNLAQNLSVLLDSSQKGVLHLAGPTRISMFDAARKIAEVFGFDPTLVQGVKTGTVGNVPRPLDTSLDVSRAQKFGLKLAGFDEGLRICRKNLSKKIAVP